MRFWLRYDYSEKIGYGHKMRMQGLKEQLLEDGHEIIDHDGCDIEVIDSYNLKPITKRFIKIPSRYWFLRQDIRAIPRGRSGTNIALSLGGSRYPVALPFVTAQSFERYPELLRWVDIMIGGYGVSLWERAYLGIPSIGVLMAENQRKNMIRARDFVIDASGDEIGSIDQRKLENAIAYLRHPDAVKMWSWKSMKAVRKDSYQDFLGML